jgi:CheY-like chemotaxis protein
MMVQGQGGSEFQSAGILKYVEDLKRGPNAEFDSKDFFETFLKKGGAMHEKSKGSLLATDRTSAKTATILLMENDQSTLNALYYFLRRSGYEVIGAGSEAEAEWLMGMIGTENISVIISDINLTSGSQEREGYEFYQRWISKDPDLAFVLISGDPTVGDLPAVRSKKVSFLAKPFNLYTLLDAVRSITREN